MNRLVISTAALALASGMVFADGIPSYGRGSKIKEPPGISFDDTTTKWGGLYVGVHGGWHDGNDGSVGGLIGYNWQAGKLVLGVEADFLKLFDGVNVTAFSREQEPIKGFEREWYASFRGNVGFATGPWLPYLTGGWAIGKATAFDIAGSDHLDPQSITPSGLVWGGGLKVRLFEPVNLGIEFKRYEFGDYAVAGHDPINLTDNVVTLRLDYKF